MRRRIDALFSLPLGERALLALAWLWLLVSDLALRVLPLSRARRLLTPGGTATSPASEAIPVERLAHLVDIAARHHLYPMTCLRRALVLQRWLQQRGLAADLQIGVRREGSRLWAHAWVEQGGEPITEAGEAGAFTPLLGPG
jgi:hypothetical protein